MRRPIPIALVVSAVTFSVAAVALSSADDTNDTLTQGSPPEEAVTTADSQHGHRETSTPNDPVVLVRVSNSPLVTSGDTTVTEEDRIARMRAIWEEAPTLCGAHPFDEAVKSRSGFNEILVNSGLVADVPSIAAQQIGPIDPIYCHAKPLTGEIAYIFSGSNGSANISFTNDKQFLDDIRESRDLEGERLFNFKKSFDVIVNEGKPTEYRSVVDSLVSSLAADTRTVDIDSLVSSLAADTRTVDIDSLLPRGDQ